MKIKVEDKKKIKEFREKQKQLCRDYNLYSMAEIKIGQGGELVFYELDKLTPEERRGTIL